MSNFERFYPNLQYILLMRTANNISSKNPHTALQNRFASIFVVPLFFVSVV